MIIFLCGRKLNYICGVNVMKNREMMSLKIEGKFASIVDLYICMFILVQERSLSPTLVCHPRFLKYQMDIYWPIMNPEVTNNEML